ncbi:hypothetical protein [Deinococcus petrolearius]|uniref:Uncharacterized protein n=1 Tax=Deinococcus petrolearius TaxID=1751295 RepID=A0ABW1DKT6_9DEIO
MFEITEEGHIHSFLGKVGGTRQNRANTKPLASLRSLVLLTTVVHTQNHRFITAQRAKGSHPPLGASQENVVWNALQSKAQKQLT